MTKKPWLENALESFEVVIALTFVAIFMRDEVSDNLRQLDFIDQRRGDLMVSRDSSAAVGATPAANFCGIVSELPGSGITRVDSDLAVSCPIFGLQFCQATLNTEVV